MEDEDRFAIEKPMIILGFFFLVLELAEVIRDFLFVVCVHSLQI